MVYTWLHVSIALLLVPRFLDLTRLDLTHFVGETLGRPRDFARFGRFKNDNSGGPAAAAAAGRNS